MKIFISGPSGIGKTTMAIHLAKEYNIPFIQGSSKVLWEKYDINSHKELIQKTNTDPDFGINFQFELLHYRNTSIEGLDNFVTDRSPMDNLVYFMLQVSDKVDSDITFKYMQMCRESYPKDYLQIFMGLNYDMCKQGLEDDGFRVTNIYYQLMVNAIFDQIISGNWLDIKMEFFQPLKTWDFDKKEMLVKHKIRTIYGR